MNEEDKKFLKELQHEMLNQPTICQADPRFWVVRQTVREYGIDENWIITGQEIISNSDESIGETMEDFHEDIKDKFDDIELSEDKKKIIVHEDNDNEFYLDTLSEAIEFVNSKYDYYDLHYDLVNYKEDCRIVPNTMFLTLRECEEHIKRNHYHYNEPSPYAMTAWRSPQVERLYKIIQNTNWEDL